MSKMDRDTLIFLPPVVLVMGIIGKLLFNKVGEDNIVYNIAWLVPCLLVGWLVALVIIQREKDRRRVAWREAHPGVADEFMPEKLRKK